jgi:hypothetical protein
MIVAREKNKYFCFVIPCGNELNCKLKILPCRNTIADSRIRYFKSSEFSQEVINTLFFMYFRIEKLSAVPSSMFLLFHHSLASVRVKMGIPGRTHAIFKITFEQIRILSNPDGI